MRSRRERDALRKVAEIRALKCAAAEAAASQAQALHRKETEALELRKAELEKTQEHWRESVGQGALRLDIAPLWGQTVRQEDARFHQAGVVAERAASAHDVARKALGAADQTSKLADRLAKRAANFYRRDLEEAALNDATDRHLQHGRKS
jgi:hypothetical protein